MPSATSEKRTRRIRLIVFTALMTALTTALTIASVPLASGYYNFGDVPIFMTACLLGPLPALVTGALGAALGDVILGYMAYAPFTLIIKALEGLVAALFFKVISKPIAKKAPQAAFYCLGNILSGLIMAFGYFLAEGVLLSEERWSGGIVNLPFNILQGSISAIVATTLLYVCQLKKIFERIFNRNKNFIPPKNEETHCAPSENDAEQNDDSDKF